jgi:hypothetical protein
MLYYERVWNSLEYMMEIDTKRLKMGLKVQSLDDIMDGNDGNVQGIQL